MQTRFATFSQVSFLMVTIAALGPACDSESADQPDGVAEVADTDGESDGDSEAGDSAGESDDASLGSQDPALGLQAGELDPYASRTCFQNNHCMSACICTGGLCQPDGFGPPPPSGYCDQAPQRACSAHSDCQSTCECSGGFCVPDGFGPSNPYCFLPPPDAYEEDDAATQWQAYVGVPQLHNFDAAGDEDWIAVYFGSAINARFQTYGLSWGTNTVIEVYRMTSQGGVGKMVGSNDDVGGPWWVPDSLASRVDVAVPADSAYLVRVLDASNPSLYTDSLEFPRYTLSITAN
jgi:hypothetical protein